MEYCNYNNYRDLCRLYNTKCKTVEYIKIYTIVYNANISHTSYVLEGLYHNPKGPAIIYYNNSNRKYAFDHYIHGARMASML